MGFTHWWKVMKSLIVTSLAVLIMLPGITAAQNCCAPAVSQQGVLGETVALPHVLEIGLHYEALRARLMYSGGDAVSDPSNTKADWKRGTLTLAYGIVPRLSFSAAVPYIWKKKEFDLISQGKHLEYTAEGIGDISFFLRFSLLPRDFVNYREVSVGLGLKLPTGSTDRRNYGFLLPEELQPGTGSWDYYGSVSFYQGFERVDFYLSGMYHLTSSYEEYKFGDQFSYLLSSNFHVASRVDLSAAFSGMVQGRDRQGGVELESTGRHQIWFVPGIQLQLIPQILRLQVYYEEPVYQHFNGTQLGSDCNIRLTVACTLPLWNSSED